MASNDDFDAEDDQFLGEIDIDAMVKDAQQVQPNPTSTPIRNPEPPSTSSSPEVVFCADTRNPKPQPSNFNKVTARLFESTPATSTTSMSSKGNSTTPCEDKKKLVQSPITSTIPVTRRKQVSSYPTPAPPKVPQREGCIVYVDGLSKYDSRSRCSLVNARGELSPDVTHYIYTYNDQVQLCLSANLYLALARKIWVVSTAWLTQYNKSGSKPDEQDYTLDKIPTLNMKRKYVPTQEHQSSQKKLLHKIRFVLDEDLPWKAFRISRHQMIDIILAAGGTILSDVNVEPEPETFLQPFKATYVVATVIPKKIAIDIYFNQKWLTIHPEYILDCIWDDEILEIPPTQLFTPSSVIKN